jgi:hypothetical protein
MKIYRYINFFHKKIRKYFLFRLIFPSKKITTVCVVIATRYDEKNFWSKSPAAITLPKSELLRVEVAYNNKEGLSKVYNTHIEKHHDADVYIFIHDDVWIKDNLFLSKIIHALTTDYDIVGVAGNTRISPKQPAWLFKEYRDENFILDHDYLSGSVSHGTIYTSHTSYYGPAPKQCELLDGVFLACSGDGIRKNQILFDEQFGFHFYDLDFCRSAAKKGLLIGTWPIDLIHESGGAFGSLDWKDAYLKYLGKWKS